MRVITGSARGMRLKTLPGQDVRPTTEEVKEAIFSILHFELEGAVVLDLFAGSGQLGIEALSRGAKKVVFVDNSPECVKIIKENLLHTRLEESAQVSGLPNGPFLKGTSETFDIAILDPPYGHGLIQKSMPLLTEKMSENGIIVCEHEKELTLPEQYNDFTVAKTYRHSRTTLTVYRRNMDDSCED